MKEYKLTVFSSGETIGEGSFALSANAWLSLGKEAEEDVIAVLWVYNNEQPILINEDKVMKAYTEQFGEVANGISPLSVGYWCPFMVGLVGDESGLCKKITLDMADQSFKKGSDPNRYLFCPTRKG